MNPSKSDSQGCTHPSLDGLAGTDILVCMSCNRLIRRFGYMDIDGIPLTGYHDLNCIEVKTLFRALEIAKEAEIAALMHDNRRQRQLEEGRDNAHL